REAGGVLDRYARQHGLAHREADGDDRYFGGSHASPQQEDRRLRGGAVRRRRAELFAFEIFRRSDAAALAPDDRERRLVVDHEYGLDRRARVGVAELDQRIDVAEAHVVGAGGDAIDRLKRAGRGIDRDVEAFGLEVALVDRDHERGSRALELEVERELDGGLLLRRDRGGGEQRCGENSDPAEPESEGVHPGPFPLAANWTRPHPRDLMALLS